MYEVVKFPTIDMKRTGRQIERLRKDRGLSVRELQAYFGFEHPQAIYKWQWGESLPSVDNLFALARLLRVPMQDLLVGTDQEVPPFLPQNKNAPDHQIGGSLLSHFHRMTGTVPSGAGRRATMSRAFSRLRFSASSRLPSPSARISQPGAASFGRGRVNRGTA